LAVTTDPITAEVMAANQRVRDGDHAGGRALLEAIWERVEGGSPIHACLVAHHLADVQDDPAEELAWDLRALEAAGRCTDADVRCHTPVASIAGFMPSLHMSLAQDYLRLRDVPHSREHLDLARGFESALADDDYGRLIRGAMTAVAQRLDGLRRQPST
jgi:hypothetical protein